MTQGLRAQGSKNGITNTTKKQFFMHLKQAEAVRTQNQWWQAPQQFYSLHVERLRNDNQPDAKLN